MERPSFSGSSCFAPSRRYTRAVRNEAAIRRHDYGGEANSPVVRPVPIQHGTIEIPGVLLITVLPWSNQPFEPSIGTTWQRGQSHDKQATGVQHTGTSFANSAHCKISLGRGWRPTTCRSNASALEPAFQGGLCSQASLAPGINDARAWHVRPACLRPLATRHR